MRIDKKVYFSHSLGVCEFRVLDPSDITEKYIIGLKEEQKYIEHIPINVNIKSQADYISNIIISEKDTICGLFLNSELIGTAGIQNIKDNKGTSIGIFLFDNTLRGRGFGKILVWASCYLIIKENNCALFFAGMKKENIASLKAFLSCGFKISSESKNNYRVEIEAHNLITPPIVRNIKLG